MIHDRLKDVYDEFDRHCRSNNVDYSIDADYYNVQAYRLLGRNDVPDILRHMSNYVRGKWVGLEYDGLPVNYDKMKSQNFDVPTYNPLFKFTLQPIQEEENMPINEDSIKGPSNAHGRKQAAFPASFRQLETRDTYVGGKKKKKKSKKKSKKDKPESESLHRPKSFSERLLTSINETVGVSMVDPEILMTRNAAERKEEESEEQALEGALQAESLALCKYLTILENTDDELNGIRVEGLIDRCTKQINELNALLEDRSWEKQQKKEKQKERGKKVEKHKKRDKQKKKQKLKSGKRKQQQQRERDKNDTT